MCIINLYLAFIGLMSSNIPNNRIKNDAISIDIINGFWLPNNIKPNKKLRNIAIPPSNGVGFLWTLLSFGMSIMFIFFDIFIIKCVSINDVKNVVNIIINTL